MSEATIILGLIIIFVGFVAILTIPIAIAKKRKLKEEDVNIISLLSWFSLLLGITWIIALIMALVCKSRNKKIIPNKAQKNLDKLSKLFKLKEKGVITQKEFERAKKDLL